MVCTSPFSTKNSFRLNMVLIIQSTNSHGWVVVKYLQWKTKISKSFRAIITLYIFALLYSTI